MTTNEQRLVELTNHLELIKTDLRWQLSFEDVDWDHFQEFVKSAEVIQAKVEELKLLLANDEVLEKRYCRVKG